MKKVFFFIIFLFILAGAGIFFYQFFWVKNEKGALQITSLPESKVYLNGEYIGNTPICRCPKTDSLDVKNIQEMLPVGDYTVRLIPTKGNLPEFQEKVTVEKSVLTVVDRKFAEGASSEGVVISLTDINNDKTNELTIISIPDKAEVYIDDSLKGQTPLFLKDLTASDHTLSLQKDGYKTKTINIRATNGYKLLAKEYLGIDPSFIAGATTTASSSASISPTPSISVTKVRILQTGTGFLRVRDDASLGGKEVGRVSPGQDYALLDEKPGWFEIQMTEKSSGWISSQYAEKVQ